MLDMCTIFLDTLTTATIKSLERILYHLYRNTAQRSCDGAFQFVVSSVATRINFVFAISPQPEI